MSFLSDTDSDSNSDSAVNELLSQAKDLCVLEQLSALNCASFSHDSVLASDLESRFARLKSFPSTTAAATTPKPKPIRPLNPPPKRLASPSPPAPSAESSPAFSTATKGGDSKIGSPAAVRAKRSDDRRSEAEEPPSMGCSFWCSPKKGFASSAASGRKKKNIKEVDWKRKSDFGWSKNEELLEDLGSFSIEEQRKILKKAMAEQKKISKEARKIVKMAKKASVGKSLHNNGIGTEDELSD